MPRLVQGMLSLQKLQSLATLHQQQQQQQQKQTHSPSMSVPLPSLAGLQGLAAGLSTATSLNSPLNLSVTQHEGSNNDGCGGGGVDSDGSGGVNNNSTIGAAVAAAAAAAASAMGGACSQMPQLILASGQLVQGVQGAQLLIPTSQGKLSLCFK